MKYAAFKKTKDAPEKGLIVHRVRHSYRGSTPACSGGYGSYSYDERWLKWSDKRKSGGTINYWALSKNMTDDVAAFRFLAGIPTAPDWFLKGRPCAKCFPQWFEVKVVPKVAHFCPTCGQESVIRPKANARKLKKGWDNEEVHEEAV